SAITSRLTSDARMPAEPMVMPSEMEMVLNSIGVPPAERIASFSGSASARRCRLHGPISVHVLATPTMGRSRSSRLKPAAKSIARAAARLGPSVTPPLCHLGLDMTDPNDARKGRNCQTYNVCNNIKIIYKTHAERQESSHAA